MGGSARGRPARTPEQVAEMRAHIAACALDLFHAEGYVGISMRRLASEAGCTPMTLYKYFENKFEILGLLWAEVLGELFDRLDGLAAGASGAEHRLQAVANGYVQFWIDHRDHYYLVFMSGGVTQEDVSRFMGDDSVLARFDLFRSCIADLLGPAVAPGEIEVKAEVLVCGLNGIAQALVTLSGYPWADPDTLVRRLISGLVDT